MILTTLLLLATAQSSTGDTIRLEIGSPQLDARVYRPHSARVLVRVGASDSVTNTWTNELTLGDSAGRPVMRWVTTSASYVLRQTYDGITMAPLGYHMAMRNGAEARITVHGNRVRGTRRTAADTTLQQVDITLDRPGFFVGASDLVPAAVGFRPGRVIIAPVWHPTWQQSQWRAFAVVGREAVTVEGTVMEAWKVDEYTWPERRQTATWWLLDASPYMVYGTVPMANGQVQRMSEVEIPHRP